MDERYFLFGVPSVDDDELKRCLCKAINYTDGIRDMNWWKPADDKNGGVVRLDLDQKALELLLKVRNVKVKGKTATFVDRQDVPLHVQASIDDDTIELVKTRLAAGGIWTWTQMTEGLKMTKKQNEEDKYDYWIVEGSSSNMKCFHEKMREVLVKTFVDPTALDSSVIVGRHRNPDNTVMPDDVSFDEDKGVKSSDLDTDEGQEMFEPEENVWNTKK